MGMAFMVRTSERIAGATVVPMAFRGRPPLITVGVREPYALRAIVEITTGSGVSGVGETYGGTVHPERLRRAADEPAGMDVGGPRRADRPPLPRAGRRPHGRRRLVRQGRGQHHHGPGTGSGALPADVARGPVVREEALHEALVSGAIAGAALDAWGPARPTRRAGRPSTTCRTS
ncbi:hypothetical protein GCM10023238_16440 [Streptomyces heliomycini]